VSLGYYRNLISCFSW